MLSRTHRIASQTAWATVDAERNCAAHDLREPLGESGRYLRGMCVEHVPSVVVVDAGTCQGHDVVGGE
jgi:hypothetical protein